MSFVLGLLVGAFLCWYLMDSYLEEKTGKSTNPASDPTIAAHLAALDAAQKLAAAAWVTEAALQAEAKKYQQTES